jgi:ParB-like chromosome segregation protein Spo0J
MKKTKSLNSEAVSLEIKYLPIDTLIAYARNPRTHSEEQIAQIAASIREFGFTNPILIDSNNGIIAGHGRLAAAKELGLEKVPCIDLSHLTDEQKRVYLIADNKLALNGGWNDELLRLELTDLKELGANLELTGFDAMELADIMLGKDVEFKEYDESAADDVQLLHGELKLESILWIAFVTAGQPHCENQPHLPWRICRNAKD